MIYEVPVIIFPEQENNQKIILNKIIQNLAEKNIKINPQETKFFPVKKSIDARHSKVKFLIKYKVYVGEEPENSLNLPEWKKANSNKSVIIVGSGPAGIFAALKLLESGIKPIIIERGTTTSERKKDIAEISTKGIVGLDSNYCFGEGGAGTFSDGKLYTRSNKRGDISKILKIFYKFGADKKILTDSHPHIGTEKLPAIINNIRNFIIELGGEFHFNTRCTDFIIEENEKFADENLGDFKDKTYAEKSINKSTEKSSNFENENLNQKILVGIKTQNTKTSQENIFYSDAIILATGHSATDIYKLVAKHSPKSLEEKTFAVGVRVEHPREVIDKMQYHSLKQTQNLGAAEYRFTSQQNGRGVYSFCMCPGGFVVPSSTGSQEIVVNGMSTAKRNSRWSNAAIVVESRKEDIPEEFVKQAKELGTEQLAGLLWRQWLEKESFLHGEGQKAPAQRLVDFLSHKKSETLPQTSYAPGIISSRLDEWLPNQISERLAMAFSTFERNRKGFINPEALMIAIETRTSTPVRILRNKEDGECVYIKNLFPAGEGAGYAGGIVSSAMDGENQAEKIVKRIILDEREESVSK